MKSTTSRQIVLMLVMCFVLVGGSRVYGQAELSSDDTQMPRSENPVQLINAEGMETVTANCTVCHTIQPIVTHSGFTDEIWAKEVDKMIKQYGAVVSDEDKAVIVAYLQENYGGDPASSENILLNGSNATSDMDPIFAENPVIDVNQTANAEGTPDASEFATPEATPLASPEPKPND